MRWRSPLRGALAGMMAGVLGVTVVLPPDVALAQMQASAAASARLSEALRQLAQDPQNLSALISAGQSALALDELDAALAFFRRGQVVAPSDGRIKAGLASVMVRQGQPLEALRLFAEAEQAGEPMQAHAARRGLAYDLVGDNARAQDDYRVALSLGVDPVITRRLALSQAISGDRAASEATLLPLLQQGDLAAYRTRAFALAILGRTDEAVSIAQDMLPAQISSRLAPYLRYMPRLTKAQQAAAANLGSFPQAAQIGREDPAFAAYLARSESPQIARGSPDARLAPSGRPMGPRANDTPVRSDEATTMLTAETAPAMVRAAQVTTAANDQPVAPAGPARPAAAMLAPTPAPAPVPAPVVVSVLPEPEPPQPSLARVETSTPPLSAPVVVAPEPPEPRDLSLAFAEFAAPAPRVAAARGAVDITRIEPPREAPPPVARPAPPPPPMVPSRHWVQVATGRDTDALAFDWRRIKRNAGGLLDKGAPHIAAWGQTNRLVTGPFDSAREADELVSKLKEKEVDSFRFTSARGEDVKALD